MNATTERNIDRWFAHYSDDHRNTGDQRIHVVAVPLILWSVVALLWCLPVPGASAPSGGRWVHFATACTNCRSARTGIVTCWKKMPTLKKAFAALTPGRQRGYLLHFSSAKQAKTRQSRIEKCIPQILAGKGIDDR